MSADSAFRLDGKRAVVTGAGRGIGRAVAIAFSAQGAAVTLVARNAGELESVQAEILSAGGEASVAPMDVAAGNEVAALFAREPGFDLLVNNAGINRPTPFTEVSEADFDAIMNLNLRATFFVAQAFVRRLIASGKPGVIVNMSSQMGHVGAPRRTVYCASKWAVEGLTRAMAVELAPFGIRVNAVAPTFVETPMTAPMLAEGSFRDETLGRIPLGRLACGVEVALAAAYLASDAAAMVAGHSLVVDGGWIAQ